ncbi:hypothetical protein C0995_002799 [Termitomyces sp. Mi166|nr:hypothetical protein C0995_002799 [Termitomyces sp. Mi166\
MPKAEDVRVLREVEMRKVWVWEGIVRAWRVVVGEKGEEGERERKGSERGRGLCRFGRGWLGWGLGLHLVYPGDEDLDRGIDATPPPHDEESVTKFIEHATDMIIVHILENADLDLQPPSSPFNGGFSRIESRELEIPGFSSSPKSSIVKLGLAQDMWSIICWLTPHPCIGSGAERLTQCLMKNVEEYMMFKSPASTVVCNVAEEETEDEKEMNEVWAELCVDALTACGHEAVWAF